MIKVWQKSDFKTAKIKTTEKLQHAQWLSAKSALMSMLIILAMIIMIIYPDYFVQSAQNGFKLFALSVLPALFPFCFLAITLTLTGSSNVISKIFKKPTKLLFGSNEHGANVLFLSLVSGYPVGATVISELYNNQLIDTNQAKSMFAYGSTSGPLFIIGVVGGAIFDNAKVGAVIMLSHIIATIINGIIFRSKTETKTSIMSSNTTENILQVAMHKSMTNMLLVGGFIVLGGMVVDLVRLANIELLSSTLLSPDSAQIVDSLIFGAIEMTRGSIYAENIHNLSLSCATTSAIISFGGLSILMQSYAILSNTKMKFANILTRKIVQSILSFAICFVLSKLCF